ncbi:MAG: hypothetical protein R2795_18480 [Saprospiraceae bacterium]
MPKLKEVGTIYLPIFVPFRKNDLRTRVEQANLSGSGLMQYIFHAQELVKPLDALAFRPDFRMVSPGDQAFDIQPDSHHDAFILTENCSGYLKAALDAGIEPPYSAFKAALATDDKKASTVVAIAGSFRSPVQQLLQANNAATTALMLELWQFYKQHPEYIGQAYYLQTFAGVMIKHSASSEVGRQIENQWGININGPLGSHTQAQASWNRQASGTFSGTDWETIVFVDAENPQSRLQWYAPLPDPAAISLYFARLKPSFERHADFPLLTEGVPHKHYLTVEGIPEYLARGQWMIEGVSEGVYVDSPRLEVTPFQENGRFGCRFTIEGQPGQDIFKGTLADRPGKCSVSYRIRNTDVVGGVSLAFDVKEELPTSAHPVLQMGEGRFDLSIKEDRQFAFQWEIPLVVDDEENPVNFNETPYLTDIVLRRGDMADPVDIQLKEIIPDVRRHEYRLVLETRSTWPLQQINDRDMQLYNLSFTIHLPLQRSPNRMSRPLKGLVSFPRILPLPPVVPVSVPAVTPLLPQEGEGR